MSKKKIIASVFLITSVIAASFASGFWLGKGQVPPPPIEGVTNLDAGQPEAVDFSLFWDVWRVIQQEYVDKGDLDFQKMVYGAISGMVKSLGDPYTVFLTPEDSKVFQEDVSGEFQGVGMEIDIREDELTVIAPLDGTPAQQAGLRAGDKILKVDEVFTRDITIEEAIKLIRGPKGTEVTLTIFREGWDEPKEFKIVREVIVVPSLRWEIRDDDIAYIKIYQFYDKARADFARAAMDILRGQTKKIIIDLRNNPGGYLEVAQNIAGWFLERNQVVTIEDLGPGQDRIEFRAQGPSSFADYFVVVLINRGSASGSEILAGALRDNQGIKLIGEKSFGKGSVQELKNFDDQSSLKITVAKWLTPNGDFITDKGLEPDVPVEMTEEDYDAGRDPQLDKAIEILKEMR